MNIEHEGIIQSFHNFDDGVVKLVDDDVVETVVLSVREPKKPGRPR